jgi:cell division protein FtsZ
MGIGNGTGEARAADAARQAIMSPLLEQSIDGARGVLFTITGGPDLTLFEVNEAAEIIHAAADPEANIIFGAVIDERMQNDVKISVIATGFDQNRPLKRIEPIYRRQVETRPVERIERTDRPQTQPHAEKVAVAATPAKAPTHEENKFDPDDLEVPSFLRRR